MHVVDHLHRALGAGLVAFDVDGNEGKFDGVAGGRVEKARRQVDEVTETLDATGIVVGRPKMFEHGPNVGVEGLRHAVEVAVKGLSVLVEFVVRIFGCVGIAVEDLADDHWLRGLQTLRELTIEQHVNMVDAGVVARDEVDGEAGRSLHDLRVVVRCDHADGGTHWRATQNHQRTRGGVAGIDINSTELDDVRALIGTTRHDPAEGLRGRCATRCHR